MKFRFMIAGLALGLALSLCGCGEEPPQGEEVPPCEHTYTDWIQGDTTHYQICPLCNQKHDEEPHRYANVYGQSYTLKENASATLRLASPKDAEVTQISRVSVYVGASDATLRLGRSTTSEGTFAAADELQLPGQIGWFDIPLAGPISTAVYSYFRLTAVGGEITVREVVFFGTTAEGRTVMMEPTATAPQHTQDALVDCQQEPGSLYICTVCHKARP